MRIKPRHKTRCLLVAMQLKPPKLVKAKVAIGCAKYGNVLAVAATGKAVAATDCAKYRNVLAEAATEKAEAATDCAKYRNVLAVALTEKAEAATGCTKYENLLAQVAEGFEETIEVGYLFWCKVVKHKDFADIERRLIQGRVLTKP